MQLRMLVAIFVLLTVMTGCTNGGKAANTFTLEQVADAIRAEGAELSPRGTDDAALLNHVKPSVYVLGHPTIKPVYPHSIYIYVFDSEQEMQKAKTDMSGKFTISLLTNLKKYEQGNVMIMYFATDGNMKEFNQEIQSALQKLAV
ncbi:hypothetical protein HUB94_03220 [Paenibacillus cellulosilyticus]|nr:hypothetical protein [Paenibacillus cellulosilyticus]QKS43556.1 hypothetical protein HUB94_03220 [Paenibacillus cellulosilyticus]